MNRVFERNFLELRWKHQNLKIVVWRVEGSDFLKTKDYTIDLESCAMIFGAIDVDDVICEGCKRPVEEHSRRAQTYLIVYFYLRLSLII